MFNIKGMVIASEPMWRHTTFLTGGPADLFAVPAGEEDLRQLLTAARRKKMDVFTLGGGSNILVADAGIRGLVIDTRLFREYRLELPGKDAGKSSGSPTPGNTVPGETLLVLGSGLPVSDAAWRSGSSGLKGLDFLFGMPGSVGGALWMNARCYDEEIADKLAWIEVMDRAGVVSRMAMNRGEWGYKHSPFQSEAGEELIILQAAFTMSPGDAGDLKASAITKLPVPAARSRTTAPSVPPRGFSSITAV